MDGKERGEVSAVARAPFLGASNSLGGKGTAFCRKKRQAGGVEDSVT